MSVAESIRADAARVLADGRARMVIGYRLRNGRCSTAFIADAARSAELDYDPSCTLNLAAYLVKPEVRQKVPLAVVAPPATMRSLVILAAEAQLPREAVLVLGADGQEYHGVMDLPAAAELLRARYPDLHPDEVFLSQIAELSAMSPAERAAFWRAQFEKCTRCYACRAVCPACYCQRCVVERNMPQWISALPAEHGNYAWHIIRAFHHAGRCTLCGACQAACPQGIPLMLLNVKVERDVEDEFGAGVGLDLDAKPVLGSWKPEDDDGFIK